MYINLETNLLTINGDVMTETIFKDGIEIKKEVTVLAVLKAAMMAPLKDDTRQDKEMDFIIMTKIITNKPNEKAFKDQLQLELSSDNVTRIKHKIYSLYDSWISGCMDLLLEGKKLPI